MLKETTILLVLSVGLVAASPTESKLQRFCKNKGVSLKTVDDLAALVGEVSSYSSSCSDNVIQALKVMKAIADDTRACTMEKAVAITDFVDKYLREPAESIPRALADFAVAYGMQVSGVCSREMVDSFSSEADARLYDKLGTKHYNDFAKFKKFLTEKSFVGVLLAPIIKTGEVLLPADLMQMGADKNKGMQVYSSQGELFMNMRELCQRVLQPLYEPTLLPLARLTRAGFINRNIPKGKKFEENGHFWSTAVFLCESLKLVEVKERNTPEQLAIEAKLGEAANNLPGEELDGSEDEAQVAPAEDVSIEAPESSGQVGGKIVSSSVRSLVKNFDANKSQVERLQARIARRGIRVLKVMYKRGLLGSSFKDTLDLVKFRDESLTEEFEKVKKAMVEYMEGPEHERDAIACESIERAGDAGAISHERKGAPTAKGFRKFVWAALTCIPEFFAAILSNVIYYLIIFAGLLIGSKKVVESADTWDWKVQEILSKVSDWNFGIK